jgi:CO dehydrogenase nickel-insertion accessory protein CooC1
LSPEQLLGELQGHNDDAICDLEAGVGTLLRMHPGHFDAALVVAEPTTKSIEVAKRAAGIASGKGTVIVVGNRVKNDDDVDALASALRGYEVVTVPEDESIFQADREGLAPIDASPDAPGVRAIAALADRLVG